MMLDDDGQTDLPLVHGVIRACPEITMRMQSWLLVLAVQSEVRSAKDHMACLTVHFI